MKILNFPFNHSAQIKFYNYDVEKNQFEKLIKYCHVAEWTGKGQQNP
jgi:hypothetical protein